MNARMSHTQIARYIRSGPGVAGPEANPNQVVKFAAERPDAYSSAVRHLYYRMAEAAFKGGSRANFDRYQKFVDPWLRHVDHPVSHFMSAGIEAFCAAWRAGLGDLTLDSKPSEAKAVSERIDPAAYGSGSLEELLMLVLMGQAESIWSRDAAGETFEKVRRHERHEMIANSGWDRGALSYFNERQVESANRDGGVIDLAYSRTGWIRSSHCDRHGPEFLSHLWAHGAHECSTGARDRFRPAALCVSGGVRGGH